MKTSMKRLAVFVMVAAIAIFIAAVTVSAGDTHHNTIHGEYAWAGCAMGCISTPDNFYPNGTPINPATLSSSMGVTQGIWTFKHDGTGTVTGTLLNIILPTAPNAGAALVEFSFPYTYTITDDDAITITAKPNSWVGTFVTGPLSGIPAHLHLANWGYTGYVSPDRKTITIARVDPTVVTQTIPEIKFTTYLICYASHTALRLSDEGRE